MSYLTVICLAHIILNDRANNQSQVTKSLAVKSALRKLTAALMGVTKMKLEYNFATFFTTGNQNSIGQKRKICVGSHPPPSARLGYSRQGWLVDSQRGGLQVGCV